MKILSPFLLAAALAVTLVPASAQERFDLRQHLDWQIAICYHPMYLLVDEDRGVPIVGERVPPWGAATVEDYMERVKRNLAALEKDPQLKLNYEWSACELDDLGRRFPAVLGRMRAAYQRGQLDFLGGEYAQPHAVTLGSESAWRQLEAGLEVYRRLLGKKVVVHATQESQVHRQLPQILRHFGYRYMVMPGFPWAVTITEGPFQFVGHERTYLKKGDEFFRATALDGSGLPAYFATNVRSTSPNDELMKDFWGAPPLWIDFPDLEEFHNPLERWARTALLEKALDDRFKAAPPRARGEVTTYQSYVEGVWAEELQRANRAAEEAAVLAGDLLAMGRLAGLTLDHQTQLDQIWRSILKSEHHDISWIEVTDLRRKAIDQLCQNTAAARQLTGEVATQLARGRSPAAAPPPARLEQSSVAVFNGLPYRRQALLEVSADQIPGGGGKFEKCGEHYLGFRELPAGGFASFPLAPGGFTEARESALPARIAAHHYRVEFSKEGLIRQITTRQGEDLLAPGRYLGGEIRAVIDNRWANNRAAQCKFYAGEICDVVERSGTFGSAQPPPRVGWGQPGQRGSALALSGESHLTAGGLGRHDQLTVAMWIKPSALDSSHQALLHTDGWAAAGLHFILLQDGRLQAAVNGADPTNTFSVATPGQALEKWSHVALVYDATAKRLALFIDGRKDTETALALAGPVVLDRFRLGAWDQAPRFFHGALQDVRLYGRALGEAEIAAIAGGSTDAGPGPMAWWKLDETRGEIAHDASGHGGHAQVAAGMLSGRRGGIPLRERYFFFKQQPLIKAELEFDFDGDEVGDFHIEETKLNVYYPSARAEIYHDIPFGFVAAREQEQLFATSWLYCGGLVYVNRGTIKHWVRDGVMANTLAWGGRRFSNRIHWGWTDKQQYDLRLSGRHKLEYFLIPAGPFDGAAITRAVQSWTAPVALAPGSGERSFYAVKDPARAVTSMFEKDGQVWARGYQMPAGKKVRPGDWEIFQQPVRLWQGEKARGTP